MDVDPKYEYNAPQFVDFTRMDEDEEEEVDIYFDKHHEHEDDLAFSPRMSSDNANNSIEGKKVEGPLQVARKSMQSESMPSPVQSVPSGHAEHVPSNLCSSLSKWRNSKPIKAAQPYDAISRKSARLNTVKSGNNTAKSIDASEPPVPVKRRRLNGDGVECKKVVTSNKTSAAANSQNVTNPVRVTRSLVNNKALEPKRLLSRSVENNAVTSPKVLPSTTASRGGSLHLRQQSRSKTVALPRSLDASCASTTLSGRGNTSLNSQSIWTGKPRLTLPETPSVMKRRAKSLVSAHLKTTEQLQLEKVAELQKDLARKIEKNVESCRTALAGRVRAPVHASMPTTKTEEFHFETDSRVKDHPTTCNSNHEVDFAALLRKNDAPSKASHRGVTQPKPFNLHGDKKRKRSDELVDQTGYKFETMAEKLWKFSSKTPERFRMKQSNKTKTSLNPIVESPHLTVAKTPKLVTKSRARKANVLSQADIEELEIEEMKKHQFRALPVNEGVLTRHGIGVKVVPRKPTTVPEPFCLSSDYRHTDTPIEPEAITFHANPVPKAILEGVVGVKPAKKLPLTVAQSPAFHTRKSSRLAATCTEDNQNKPVLSHPMPEYAEPFRPQLTHSVTQVKPFSFEAKTQEMFRHREEQIKKVLHEEEEARKFVANPLPDLSTVDIPDKPPVNITLPTPFELNVDMRGEQKSRKLRQKLDEEERRKQELATFRARPPTVLQQLPFEPQRSQRQPLSAEPFQLSTELRAEKRGEYERWRAEHEQAADIERLYREQERAAAEEREIQRARSEAVHHAQPIRHFKPVPPRQVMPLTAPQSPNFSDRLRSRSGAK